MSLCIECAMCCDGTLFSYLPLGEGEAARFEGEPGLHVEDGKDRLRQPCPRLGSDGACGIYADRPRICGQYRCRLLKRVDAGRMTEDAAQVVVARAKTFRNMARDLYLEATPDGHRPGPSVNLHAARRAFRRAV